MPEVLELTARSPFTAAPIFTFRVPKPGTVDQYFGAARTFWLQRVLANRGNNYKPPIKSIVIRKKGSTRGIRFIVYESALSYFQKLNAEQNPPDSASPESLKSGSLPINERSQTT